MNIETLYSHYLKSGAICTDTRKVIPQSIFFALKGDNFDANLFAAKALEAGCSFAVVDNPDVVLDDRFLLVEDTLKTLQELAHYHRSQIKIPVLGITGTNGKTTTKELIAAVLTTKYKVHATVGNFNNHIGVPLTILSAPTDTQIMIVEMGANHPGEISELCTIAMPTHGLITNIGKAHLDGFGGFEGVVRTKRELYNYLFAHEGIIFYHSCNELLCSVLPDSDSIAYGKGQKFCDGELLGAEPYLKLRVGEDFVIETNLLGAYNYENVLASACVGKYFEVSFDKIGEAISNYVPSNNRSQFVKTASNTVFMDAYNANPTSMTAAIHNFDQINSHNKVLILGDMYELGKDSLAEHQSISNLLEGKEFAKIILVGHDFKHSTQSFPVQKFDKIEEAHEWLKDNPLTGSTILLKGSRGMKMERLMDVL